MNQKTIRAQTFKNVILFVNYLHVCNTRITLFNHKANKLIKGNNILPQGYNY